MSAAILRESRQRLRSLGARSLSDSEALALVIGSDHAAAARLLVSAGGMAGLARRTEADLAGSCGPATASRIVAALEVGRRAARALAGERAQIIGPADAAALLMPRLAHLDREESWVIVLDRRHRVLREVQVGQGGVAHTPMEPREVFAAALREPGAAAILVAHNHPSGETTPSSDDLAITRRIERGAELVGLEFVDHVIVGARGWHSLRGA